MLIHIEFGIKRINVKLQKFQLQFFQF